jgi:hypothetical protein
MTKSHEKGENEITREAKQLAALTGKSMVEILAEMRRQAKAVKDTKRQRKIVKAEKYLLQRNKTKRKRES